MTKASRRVRESVFEIIRTRTHRTPRKGLSDHTGRVLSSLFPAFDSPAFPHDRIDLRTVAIFGQPDSGKTTLAESLAEAAHGIYGDRANIIGVRGARFRDLAAKMDSRPVQLLVIDDAKEMSRAGMSNIEDMSELDDVRHRFHQIRVQEGEDPSGYIISVHIKQRYIDLDIKFRNAHYRFFKSATAGDRDKWDLIGQLGPEGYRLLERITYRMNELRDQSAKSRSVVKVAWIKEAGAFHAPDILERRIEWHRLEAPDSLHRSLRVDPSAIKEVNDSFAIDIDPVLEMISGDGEEWPAKVSIFKAYQDAGSQSEVASRFAVTQGTVSNYTKEVKGMISKVIGEEYEEWAAKKWDSEKDVVKVERFGGKGEPDLLVHHDDGRMTVVSCKCYFDSKTTSIPIKEFEPEILKARDLQAQGLLRRLVVDFNNIAKRVRVLRGLDPVMHDSTITFR